LDLVVALVDAICGCDVLPSTWEPVLRNTVQTDVPMRVIIGRSRVRKVMQPVLVCRVSQRSWQRPPVKRHTCQRVCLARSHESSNPDKKNLDFEFDGLTQEEDWVVPGSNLGSLSQNTELGQAVNLACDELDHLGNLETGVLQQADDILKKFGFKTKILEGSQPKVEE
jgi:hypothetical protein